MRRTLAIALAILSLGCGRDTRAAGDAGEDPILRDDAGLLADAGRLDGGPLAPVDAGGGTDASSGSDGGAVLDAGSAGPDAGSDAGAVSSDAGGGGVDAGPPGGGCISGAVGTHVARFRWEGSGSGSTAYVRYEANTLPDTSRWRAGAYSRGAIGSYTPTYVDPFLAEGGLELGGTNFIDVELSTAGLGSVRNATPADVDRAFAAGRLGFARWSRRSLLSLRRAKPVPRNPGSRRTYPDPVGRGPLRRSEPR